MLTGLVKTGELVNPSIGHNVHSKADTTHLRWNSITATAVNNLQLTFIQLMRLLVIDFGLAHRLLSLHLFTCVPTYMRNTRTQSCTQPNEQGVWVGWMVQASEGPTLGSWVTHALSVLPSVPTSYPWNKYQTPCKPCTKQDYVKPNIIPLAPQGCFVPQLYHKPWGTHMSSLNEDL